MRACVTLPQGNPNIAENLTKIQTERSNLQNLLSKTLRELRECSFATLTTTVEEEKARNDMIREVVQKEKEVSAAVKKLQADLQTEKQLHLQEVEERNEIISKLKEELVAVRTKSHIETKYLHKVARARGQSLNRAYNAQTSELEQQIWHAKKELEIEVRANQESEEFLRNKQAQLSQEIQKWMEKYEEDTEEQEKILEQLKESRAADLIKLNDYTERESKELEEKQRREEAARMKAEADRVRRAEEERNLWAATKCQALWRGYLSRQAAAGGGKKGKKGKKGKVRAHAFPAMLHTSMLPPPLQCQRHSDPGCPFAVPLPELLTHCLFASRVLPVCPSDCRRRSRLHDLHPHCRAGRADRTLNQLPPG
jgi:hypothetical protein